MDFLTFIFTKIILFSSVVYYVRGECWWTGCQPFSWAQRGCDVYNMEQKNTNTCDGGEKFYCCDKTESAKSKLDREECWWTGCQPTSWAERGCSVYQMDEVGRSTCSDGDKFHCCKKKPGGGPSTTSIAKAKAVEPVKRECWWTGCQAKSWAERGCGVYKMDEIDSQTCDGGDKYHCCTKTESSKTESSEKCWWTGCQPSSWAQRGCSVYDMDDTDSATCDGGNKYHCCPKGKNTKVEKQQAPSIVKSDKCWWTGCMPKFLKVRGCSVFGLVEKDRLTCNNGDQFHCCEETEIVAVEVPSAPEKADDCWWTGCQPMSWAQRGCGVYGLNDIGSESCTGGTKFHCCGKATKKSEETKPKSVAKKSDCWWTGCQLDSWAERGCAVYGLTDEATEACDGGLKYRCCGKKEEKEMKAKIIAEDNCSWTNCQPRSLSVRGCFEPGKMEVDTKWCEGGTKYYCCDDPKATAANIRSTSIFTYSTRSPKAITQNKPTDVVVTQECWWSGCQPMTWSFRGCSIYSMVDIDSKPCENGMRYHCCKVGKAAPPQQQQTTSKPKLISTTTTKRSTSSGKTCWWTGCQAFDWAERGCAVYKMDEVAVQPCSHGEKFHCCSK